jgi:DNA polymerase III alpha subunit
MSLPKDDVFVSTACIAFWKYEDIDDIVVQLHNHFGKNFMLEVQCHNVDKQKNINKHILELSERHSIDIICGLDSHYIYPEEKTDRDYILKYKGVKYPEEDGFYLDYPNLENQTLLKDYSRNS